MNKCRNKSWESEWYWSKVWKVSLTIYESDPEKTGFPPISLLDDLSVCGISEILRFVRLFLIEHNPSSVSISFVTSKKHKFWQSRSSVSSFDSLLFLRKWSLYNGFFINKCSAIHWPLVVQGTNLATFQNFHCSWFSFAYIDHCILTNKTTLHHHMTRYYNMNNLEPILSLLSVPYQVSVCTRFYAFERISNFRQNESFLMIWVYHMNHIIWVMWDESFECKIG